MIFLPVLDDGTGQPVDRQVSSPKRGGTRTQLIIIRPHATVWTGISRVSVVVIEALDQDEIHSIRTAVGWSGLQAFRAQPEDHIRAVGPRPLGSIAARLTVKAFSSGLGVGHGTESVPGR